MTRLSMNTHHLRFHKKSGNVMDKSKDQLVENKLRRNRRFLWGLIGAGLSVYVTAFGLASGRYQSALGDIQNQADSIFSQIGSDVSKQALERIPAVQVMKLPVKPELNPLSIIKSLSYDPIAITENDHRGLGVLENLKGLVKSFSRKEKEPSDRSPFEALNLNHINLNEMNLREANLSRVSLKRAQLLYTKLHDASLEYTALHGADLTGAEGLKDEQLMLACVDPSTTLPDNINSNKIKSNRPELCKCWVEDNRQKRKDCLNGK